jgi:hypothetical protein
VWWKSCRGSSRNEILNIDMIQVRPLWVTLKIITVSLL